MPETAQDKKDGCNRVVGSERILDHGPDADRWNLVIVAEGYRRAELGEFSEHADAFVASLGATPPFHTLLEAVNVHRLDVESCQSGADYLRAPIPDQASPDTASARDDDAECIEVNTFFDATHCPGLGRSLRVNTRKVMEVLGEVVPQWDVALVLVNSPRRGGSGLQDVAVASIGTVRSGGSLSARWGTAIHELGHSGFNLADEYDYHHPPYQERSDCGNPQDLPDDDFPKYERYTGTEPIEPNVTVATTWRETPWRHLVDREAELPTVAKEDCSVSHWCHSSPVPTGTVGLFEGAFYHRCGVYRAEFNCLMNMDNQQFCAVCQEQIRRRLAPLLLAETEGVPVFLRAHSPGEGYGPAHDYLDAEVVVALEPEPERAFGFQVRDDTDVEAGRGMVDVLRDAFARNSPVRLAYRGTGVRNGYLLSVETLEEETR